MLSADSYMFVQSQACYVYYIVIIKAFSGVYLRAAIIMLTLVQLVAAIQVRLQFEVQQEFEEIQYINKYTNTQIIIIM